MIIKVQEVTQIPGSTLKQTWREPMIKITAEDGTVYIDNIPRKRHSNSLGTWLGYDNWGNLIDETVEIVITDEFGARHNNTSREANHNIWAKHPDVRITE